MSTCPPPNFFAYPSLDAPQYLFGLMGAGEEDGVRHSRHGRAGEALAPPVAAGREAIVLGAQAVVHVPGERPVLDEDRPAGLVPFVVDVDRAAALEERGVVDHGAEIARDARPDLAGVVARALAVEIGLQAVAHRFVEQDAAVARSQDDLHLPGRRLVRVEHRDRLARRLASVPLGALAFEVPERGAPAAAARSLLTLAVSLGDGADAEAKERLDVPRHGAVAGDDQDLADLLREAGLDLQDEGVVGMAGRRGPLEEAALLGAGDVEGDALEVVAARRLAEDGVHREGGTAPVRDLRGRLRGALHRVPVEAFDVGVSGGVALLHAHAEAHRDPARDRLQDPLVEDEAAGGAVLEKEVRVVASPRQRDGEELLGDLGVHGGGAPGSERRSIQCRLGGHVPCQRTYAACPRRGRPFAGDRARRGAHRRERTRRPW
jgi:hypothetical protein